QAWTNLVLDDLVLRDNEILLPLPPLLNLARLDLSATNLQGDIMHILEPFWQFNYTKPDAPGPQGRLESLLLSENPGITGALDPNFFTGSLSRLFELLTSAYRAGRQYSAEAARAFSAVDQLDRILA